MLVIKLVLLIEWQSLQPLPRLDRHSELLDVGRLEEGGVKRGRRPISYVSYDCDDRIVWEVQGRQDGEFIDHFIVVVLKNALKA